MNDILKTDIMQECIDDDIITEEEIIDRIKRLKLHSKIITKSDLKKILLYEE
jgi:hypothetical protein